MNNRGSGWGLRNLANRIRELLVLVSLIGTSGFCQPVVIATIGDYGSGSSYAGAVADLVKSWNPDFVLSLGDNNYGGTNYIDTAIGQFYHDFIYPYVGNYGAGASSNRFFPVLGNHDWGYPFPTFEFVQFYDTLHFQWQHNGNTLPNATNVFCLSLTCNFRTWVIIRC